MTAFPITYLGAPLSTGPLPKSQYRPLIDKVASKLPAWQGRLMSRSGRLTLVKSTLSTLPIYLTMSDKLPKWVIDEIDSLRRNFLWSGSTAGQEYGGLADCMLPYRLWRVGCC